MVNVKEFYITPKTPVGAADTLLLLAGPCQIESLDHCLKIAEHLRKVTDSLPISVVFKSSYDKANRTSASSARGPGLDEGLRILEQVREQTELPVITDIHTCEQAKAAGQVVDVIQTPAFLCRQTDLLTAAGETGKPVNVKKGQFLHPEDMRYAAEKIAATGNTQIMLCERGACYGYRDLVVDFRSFAIMRSLGYPVIFDATHSVQSMGGAGGASGGARQYVPALVKAAIAFGVDGLFLECHDDPKNAPSDGASMLELSEVGSLLRAVCEIRRVSCDSTGKS